LKQHFTTCCKNFSNGIRRPHAARFGVLASAAICAIVLGGISSTAGAYQYNAYRSGAVVPPEDTIIEPDKAINPSPGCGKHPVKTGTFTMSTKDGAGRTRTFLIVVPSVYNPNNGYPIIAVYHGEGETSADSHAWGLQDGAANGHGIFVFPQGINYEKYGVGWDDTTKGYDLPFFDNMVEEVEAAYCINTGRIFAAGFSWGGDFVTALTCNRGDKIRAVAVNSATDEYNNNANWKTYQDLPCASPTHSAMRFEHAVGGDSAYPAPDFASTSSLYKSFNTCAATSTPYHTTTNTMSCVSHNSCSKEFIECSFEDSIGHLLPPHWATDTWAFFLTFH
jgi:poly(3-hydroxybutyrate) depolymerase